jgi:hypothetical protein
MLCCRCGQQQQLPCTVCVMLGSGLLVGVNFVQVAHLVCLSRNVEP